MKELKKYKLLMDKKKELEIKLQSPREVLEGHTGQQIKEITAELNKYEAAFNLLTEREQQLMKLRYEQHLSIITVINLLYISKTTYYEDIKSIETKVHSFFEGAKMKMDLGKL